MQTLQNSTSKKVLYRKAKYIQMRVVCAEPHVQYTSKVQNNVCIIENVTESRNYFTNTFKKVMDKRNPYQS